MGRISVEVLKEGGKNKCSRLTFHSFDINNPTKDAPPPKKNTKKGNSPSNTGPVIKRLDVS